MVTVTQSVAFCFHFLVFYMKHALSLFFSNIQGPQCIMNQMLGVKNSSFESLEDFSSAAFLFV